MKKILFLLLAISIVSCKKTEKKVEETSKPKVKLHQLVGGTIFVKKLEVFSQDSTYKGQTKEFTDTYYVIEHPKGNLMWDAGLPEQFVMPEPFDEPSGVFRIQRPDSLANQLNSIGFKKDDFKYFAMSHSHFDHTGHANYMKDATWIVQENEYNSVLGDSLKTKNPAVAALKNVKKIKGDYDVFGDGTVVIKYMPGHTVGHQVLYVDLGLEKPILLAGDLYHFKENREHKRVPSFNYDVKQTLESMEKFEAFAKEKNAEVIIQHSPQDFLKLQEILAKNKTSSPKIFEGEFVYVADAASFTDCKTGKIYSITGNEDYILLQKAYLNADHETYEPEWVKVSGELKMGEKMNGGLEEQLVISKFISLDENKKCN
ncbi:MBL fold metallo-hydrolase [Polaribacter batillariae]|uniref:MBL fold metallo-hydrolase n=1 Tax=Polaribacter batillariae TaxID=2808900 RepID=A0ABX7SSS1_9FLAO|nr:MBL fold metallo-hydrolase [Polaribacter batillariae]QTD36488.1 MBL fold metallo-hydrolase [Polaribacter batillariae]